MGKLSLNILHLSFTYSFFVIKMKEITYNLSAKPYFKIKF